MPLLFAQNERNHVINWIVVRHPNFLAALNKLKPAKHDDTGVDAMAFKNTNVLIGHLKKEGPIRTEQPHFTYDKHNDLYHSHAVNASPTYNVIWEADEDLRIIHILNIAPHENFNYTRKVNKTESIHNALNTLKNTPYYQNMFTVRNMCLNPELRAMYEGFVTGKATAPKIPALAIKTYTYEEMEKHLSKAKP